MDRTGFSGTLVLIFLLSAYGWGRLGRACCDIRIFRFHSLSAVIGLSLLNFIGGLLNLLGWAKAEVLLGLLLGGLVFGGLDFLAMKRRRAPFSRVSIGPGRPRIPWGTWTMRALPIMLALIGGGVACALLVPTSVLNYGDDFRNYAPRVARMVQTGSVAGNAFDGIGMDSLGSQSFFHGFFLPDWDITLLNAFDAVACFALCLLLVAELSVRWRLPWYVGALGVICVMAINPQCVNISPLYSGALLVTGLVITGAILARSPRAKRSNRGCRLEFTLALLASFLLTLKTTLAFFAFFYLISLYLILFLKVRDRQAVLKSAIAAGFLIVLFVLPWTLLHVSLLRKAKQLGTQFKDAATLSGRYPSIAAHDIPELFSFKPLLYGDTPASFLPLVCTCIGVALASFYTGWRRRADPRATELISLTAVGVAVPAVYLLNAHLFPGESAIRYSCPILIGCFPIACFASLRLGERGSACSTRRVVLSAAMIAAAILIFSGTFRARFDRAAANRTILSFPIDQNAIGFTTLMVSRLEMLYCRLLQSRMQADSTALVWIGAPFQLDFSRNQLITVTESGLINPALHFPAGADLESLRSYLRKWGIRYILIETSGGSVRDVAGLEFNLKSSYSLYRKFGDYGIYFRKSLLALAERSRVVYSDPRMVLFELDAAIDQAKTVP